MKKAIPIDKTCIDCGAQKPLAAFLQMTGSHGTIYGNVCAICRGANAKINEVINLSEDEHGSTSAGLRIDADAKVQAEINEKKFEQEQNELTLEELKKRDQLDADKAERFDIKQKAEINHRRNYIEIKQKQGFLRFQDNKSPQNKETSVIRQNQEKRHLIETHQKVLEIQKTDAAKEEMMLTTTDLSVPTLGIRTDEVRHQGAAFNHFMKWLGNSAPIVKAAEQAFNKKVAETAKDQKNTLKSKDNKEAPTEYVNHTWTSSRKK